MKAKDTVLNLDNFGDFGGVNEYYLAVIKENQLVQAEISFEAGKQEGIQTGRKEVAEWLMKRIIWIETKDFDVLTENLTVDLLKYDPDWQFQLKDWGLEKLIKEAK